MNTSKQTKVFGGFKVTAAGRVLVSDLALLQDIRKELDRAYAAPVAEANAAASPHYSASF